MNLYHLLYGGVKDAPSEAPKTKPARFAMLFWREGILLIKLNLLFLCSSLPVLTIGPSLGALAELTGRLVRGEPVLLWQDYWIAFRRSFWPCFRSGVLLAACGAALFSAGAAAVLLLPESVWRYAGISLACALWLLLCGAAVYAFPLHGKKTRSVWKKAWLLSLAHPQHALPCALLVTSAGLLCVLFLPYSLPVWLLFLWSFPALAVRLFVDADLQKAETDETGSNSAKFHSFD